MISRGGIIYTHMARHNRIYQIDLFRFLAAFGVLIYHYTFRGPVSGMSSVGFEEIGDFFKYGIFGVHLFFIISGFVIPLSIENGSVRKFIISRITRLYPAYWFCVIFTFLVILFWGNPFYSATVHQLIANLTMVQKYLGVEDIDGVYWSLLVELKFYALIILFLLMNKKFNISLERATACWLVITLLLAPFLNSGSHLIRVINFFAIGQWSSFFIAGIVFYLIYSKGMSYKYLGMLTISLAVSLYNILYNLEIGIQALNEGFHTFFSPRIVCGLITMLYVVFFLTCTHKLQPINSPKLLKLGILTYPLYLIHENVGFILFNHSAGITNKYIILIVIILLMFILAS